MAPPSRQNMVTVTAEKPAPPPGLDHQEYAFDKMTPKKVEMLSMEDVGGLPTCNSDMVVVQPAPTPWLMNATAEMPGGWQFMDAYQNSFTYGQDIGNVQAAQMMVDPFATDQACEYGVQPSWGMPESDDSYQWMAYAQQLQAAQQREYVLQVMQAVEEVQQCQGVDATIAEDPLLLPNGAMDRRAVEAVDVAEKGSPAASSNSTRATDSKSPSLQSSPKLAPNHSPKQAPVQTLSTSLQLLSDVDPDTLFIVRRINKLGFTASRTLKKHFSTFGKVVRVLVAHSSVRQHGEATGHTRRRPSSLGFVQMASAAGCRTVLAMGDEHEVDSFTIKVQKFERQSGDAPGIGEEDEEDTSRMSARPKSACGAFEARNDRVFSEASTASSISSATAAICE